MHGCKEKKMLCVKLRTWFFLGPTMDGMMDGSDRLHGWLWLVKVERQHSRISKYTVVRGIFELSLNYWLQPSYIACKDFGHDQCWSSIVLVQNLFYSKQGESPERIMHVSLEKTEIISCTLRKTSSTSLCTWWLWNFLSILIQWVFYYAENL